MKNKILALSIFASFSLLLSCTDGSYQEIEQGLVISLPSASDSDPGLIKTEVVSEDIFRVSTVPGGDFPEHNSLSVIPREGEQTPFTVSESEKSVMISTENIASG